MAPRAIRRPPRPTDAPPVHRLEFAVHPNFIDPAGLAAREALVRAGLPASLSVRVQRIWFLEGPLAESEVARAARELLADPVQDAISGEATTDAPQAGTLLVSVARRPGVTNPEAASAREALGHLGIQTGRIHSGRTYVVAGAPSPDRLLLAARKVLANEAIEEIVLGPLLAHVFPPVHEHVAERREIPLRKLDDEAAEALSRSMGLALSRLEMTALRAHFRELGREPTDVELETFAQTWSEHCKHKTLAGAVHMKDARGERRYANLLKETIFAATTQLDRPWCWSVFKDNAGVVAFDEDEGVCMKVETHNHPSAIEPYGGAGTGIGGVIRDILGTGLGARPIANTDVFCFGDPTLAEAEVPKGCFHPARLLEGVVAGVRDYGNRMGIPTVNGAICFDKDYVGNPVVFCGCVGLLPKGYVAKAARPGDAIVAFGGRTGRDGIHGATFSSEALHAESETVSSGAVQIGDPIVEKKVLDVLLVARDRGWFHALTDCGAGGFSSAVGEMGEDIGAEVDLAAAPLKYPGLLPVEVWISEAQERMVAAVPPRHVDAFLAFCASEDVEAVVLGRFRDDARLVLRHGSTSLGDISMEFLHNGLPRVEREATHEDPPVKPRPARRQRRFDAELLGLLAMPQIASKEWVVRQYDHEVQGGAVVRPFVGPHCGPSDAAVVAPRLGSPRGIVLSNGIQPAYGRLDPYAMAFLAVDEALRNAVAVGADPKRIALLDNFTWGRCSRPETLGALVRAAEGCRDAALLYGTPFISGKDSLNNEFVTEDGRTIVVPPTLLISAIGVIADVRKTATSDLKRAGNALWLVGSTHDELGGSHLLAWLGTDGGQVPQVQATAPRTLVAVSALVRQGKVRAAHDLSEGGLAVAAAEMAIGSDFGAEIDLAAVPGPAVDDEMRLFSESPTRFLLEIDSRHVADVRGHFEKHAIPHAEVGRVVETPHLVMRSSGAAQRILQTTVALRAAWRSALPPAGPHASGPHGDGGALAHHGMRS